MAWQLNEKISEQIREETSELLAEMETALLELENAPDDMNMVNRVFRAMHTVKGAANMFGLDPIADLTHEVETVFDLVRNGKLQVSRALLDVSFMAKDLIWSLTVNPEAADISASEKLKELLRSIASGEALTLGPVEEAPQTAVESEPEVAPSVVAQEGEVVLDADASASTEHHYAVCFRPRGQGMLARLDPLGVLDDLRELGASHFVCHVEDVPCLEELDPETCRFWWEVLVLTSVGENGLRDVFIFVEDSSEITIEEVDSPEEWLEAAKSSAEQTPWPAPSKAPPSLEPPAPAVILPESEPQAPVLEPVAPPEPSVVDVPVPEKEADVESQFVAPPPPAAQPSPVAVAAPAAKAVAAKSWSKAKTERAGAARSKKDVASSIRVDAYKLDDMVALVGELVIAQARLSQLAVGGDDPRLQAVAEEIELLSGSLRDRTLSMRMLPIGTSFDRFRRLVRDLSHELGKEIELVTQGAETELDKTVIEQLGDPLVHLMRNSIDHGMEPPDAREAAGKPRRGTIVLSAEHSGGHVLIKIFDDGRGLDREKIARKAEEGGLITDAASMSDKEIFLLIFQPGFSTADTISNVSGRGVGMDVVKRSIEALRGSVDIESSRGAGTTVTVKLPLTLAIIEGLQVRVGDEYFIIPLAAVRECVELTAIDKGNASDGKRIINIRNEIVPYVRLREWFHVPGAWPEIEQIIVVGDDNSVTGIVVDEVIGQQQTVIKSLGKMFKDVEEFSGATIQADGTMALILDVPHLIGRVLQENAAR